MKSKLYSVFYKVLYQKSIIFYIALKQSRNGNLHIEPIKCFKYNMGKINKTKPLLSSRNI